MSGRFNKSRWVIPDEPSVLPDELDLEVVGICISKLFFKGGE